MDAAASDLRDSISLRHIEAPKISIVITNFNYAKYLESCIRSAVGQTYPAEVVVVDDGSTDESVAVLDQWRERIKIVTQENAGQIASYETGLANTIGDVIIFLDADDALCDTACAEVAGAFSTGVAKVHFPLYLIDQNGEQIGQTIPSTMGSGDVGQVLQRHGILYPSSPGTGNAYRRVVLEALFPMPMSDQDRHGADFFCIYGAAVFGTVAAIARPLGFYRLHKALDGDSDTAQFLFGNAEPKERFARRFDGRCRRFSSWIAERTAHRVHVPERLLDFSIEKTRYAISVLDEARFTGRLKTASNLIPWLFKALWFRQEFGVLKKIMISIWALMIIGLPKAVAFPLAQYVCNPASRGNAAKNVNN